MEKKLTLNQTWVLCLRMWRWIAKEWKKNKRLSVSKLKKRWLRDNGFKIFACESSNCFFCIYNDVLLDCNNCPGVLIDPDFCCSNANYDWYTNPPAFYAELLHLNRIRKDNK